MDDAYMDDGMRGWIHNTARRNYRRVHGYDIEDLVQEGYLCFIKCRQRYVGPNSRGYSYKLPLRDGGQNLPYLPEQPNKLARMHFHRLVKTAFENRIATLARKQPAGWETNISAIATEAQTTDQVWDAIMPTEHETASAALQLASAPDEIKLLFKLLVEDMVQLTGYRRYGRGKSMQRETTNHYFCRLLGLSPDHDLVGQVQQHFLLK